MTCLMKSGIAASIVCLRLRNGGYSFGGMVARNMGDLSSLTGFPENELREFAGLSTSKVVEDQLGSEEMLDSLRRKEVVGLCN